MRWLCGCLLDWCFSEAEGRVVLFEIYGIFAF